MQEIITKKTIPRKTYEDQYSRPKCRIIKNKNRLEKKYNNSTVEEQTNLSNENKHLPLENSTLPLHHEQQIYNQHITINKIKNTIDGKI